MHTPSIHAAVGPLQPNRADDVRLVKQFLNKHKLATHVTLTVDSHYDFKMDSAIRAFQRAVLGMKIPDGLVAVGSLTDQRLQRSSFEKFCRVFPWIPTACKVGLPSDSEYADAAKNLNCEVAAIKAVGKVESGGLGGFYPDDRPVILYERHLFHRYTGGVYDRRFSDISNAAPGGYGNTTHTAAAAKLQYGKLERAFNLDEDAAMESCSWGAFQVLGDAYDLCGFDEVVDFVQYAQASIANQLDIFVKFVQSKPGAMPAIQKKDWLAFARAYNGKNQVGYDKKMADAYAAEVKAAAKK